MNYTGIKYFVKGAYASEFLGKASCWIFLVSSMLGCWLAVHNLEMSEYRLNALLNSAEYSYAVNRSFINAYPPTPIQMLDQLQTELIKSQMERRSDSFSAVRDGSQKKPVVYHIKPKAKLEEHIVVPDPPVKILIPEKYIGPAKDSVYKPAIKIIPHK